MPSRATAAWMSPPRQQSTVATTTKGPRPQPLRAASTRLKLSLHPPVTPAAIARSTQLKACPRSPPAAPLRNYPSTPRPGTITITNPTAAAAKAKPLSQGALIFRHWGRSLLISGPEGYRLNRWESIAYLRLNPHAVEGFPHEEHGYQEECHCQRVCQKRILRTECHRKLDCK